MIDVTIRILLAYLLGAVSGAFVLGFWRGIDLRKVGSGNLGSSNAWRAQGPWFALAVFAFDSGKGAIAAGVVATLNWPLGMQIDLGWRQASCAVAAVVGHIYPIYHGFRGGKGAATYIGVLSILLPWALLPILAVWVAATLASGYVSVATLGASLVSIPAIAWLADTNRRGALLCLGTVVTVLIVYAHRDNLRRLRAGVENRFDKLRLSYWRKPH